MPKGYWIARVEVTDPEVYKDYVRLSAAAFEKHGARFLARGGRSEVVAGIGRLRNVVIEFESLDQARACYMSAEYQHAATFRDRAGIADVVLVEGFEP